MEALQKQIEGLFSDKSILEQKQSAFIVKISEYEDQIEKLNVEKNNAFSRVEELEKELLETRDGFQLKLNRLRGRIRGLLDGELTRWLGTALDASREDDPWIPVIKERLEDANF